MANKRRAFSVVLAVGSIVVAGSALLLATTARMPTAAHRPGLRRDVAPPRAAAVMAAVGLDAETLAACGVTSQQAGRMALLAHDSLTDGWAAIAGARRELDAATDARDAALNGVRDGGESARLQLSLSEQRLQTAQTNWNAACTSLRTTATAELSAEQLALLAASLANNGHQVPAAFRVVNRTPQQWIDLQRAINALTYSAERGESPQAGLSSIVSQAEADEPVSAAKSRVSANLAAIRAALSQ